jgi:hypothetical protein
MNEPAKERPVSDKANKKEYVTPHLLEYGNIAKLTKTQTGTGTDGGAAGHSLMMCL